MPSGVHNGTRGPKRKTDEARIADGQGPRGVHPLATKLAHYTPKSKPLAIVAPAPNAATKGRVRNAATAVLDATTSSIPALVGMPEAPGDITAAARRVWDSYAPLMAGRMRTSDARALSALCEDEAIMSECYRAIYTGAKVLEKAAEAAEVELTNTPIASYLISKEGHKLMTVLAHTATRVRSQRTDFGLNPASRVQIAGGEVVEPMDDIEKALCG